jgi:hypothetical protein
MSEVIAEWKVCESCDERNPTVRRRDGTGEPDADLCDECIDDFRNNDRENVQW